MKKIIGIILLTAVAVFALAGCGVADSAKTDDPQVKCENGTFVGQIEKDSGVMSFKGIPYAKSPTGDLRWKAPEPAEPSDETFDAKNFGKTSIQYEWHSEPASYCNEAGIGEDCLTLNVWTQDLDTKKKPVLVYFHGGGFAWGGTADPLYDGQYIAQEYKDMVVVTANYRVGMMGLIDFSKVEGGENFPDATHLQVMDAQQSLKWVKENISAFGGDPENVTIFGESAGGAMVSILMTAKNSEGLFQRAIAESGCVNLTYSQEEYDSVGLTDALLKKTGAKNMDDLMAIPEKELIDLYTNYDDDGLCLNDLYNMPMRDGDYIPKDPYKALADGACKDVDFTIGTNSDEWRYWVAEMGEKEFPDMTDKEVKENLTIYKDAIAQTKWDEANATATASQKKDLKKVLNSVNEDKLMWKQTEIANDTGFRIPSVVAAQNHAKAGGKSYMYYFEKKNDTFDWLGACHASECAYVFHNLTGAGFSGTMDKSLADKMCGLWVNFAKTGTPSYEDFEWTQYTPENRETLIVGDDSSLKMENDPKSEQTRLMMPFAYYYLK